ncbi:hypothetical protein Cob_v001339 [Colletotrichum orbiculare MAFF 240422]|uniref:Uncharacterized protein n=1 Tax=Colletotrichum orbiculare (strain 104-T / ATCC 96160 / CBS 514.97 / LARS 414 / MAFF 240422) TaxID=1213857 RepID=A0A484G7I0_COLOR|nr:hypothetical protein Cob_v001339 [Colletotrichum orbiculare MAFF 240422]
MGIELDGRRLKEGTSQIFFPEAQHCVSQPPLVFNLPIKVIQVADFTTFAALVKCPDLPRDVQDIPLPCMMSQL